MKSILLLISLFIFISFSGISQVNCSPVLDSSTYVIKNDTLLSTCLPPYLYLICPGVKVTVSSNSCTNDFYLENNAKLILDSNSYSGSIRIWAKNRATLDANFKRVLVLHHETATNLVDTTTSFDFTSRYVCPTLTFDYSRLPGGVSGCAATTGIETVVLPEITLEVFPNPADKILNIRTNETNYSLVLFNAIGKVVWEGKESQIELNFPKGVYFLQLTSTNRRVTKKVVIK